MVLIHNTPTLINVQKFCCLNSALKDSAKEVIHSREITDNNHVVALELLKKRFENKCLRIRHLVQALFELSRSLAKRVSIRVAINGGQVQQAYTRFKKS